MNPALLALAIQAIGAIVQAIQDAAQKSDEERAQLIVKLQAAIQQLADDRARVTADISARDAATEKALDPSGILKTEDDGATVLAAVTGPDPASGR
jgi:hypothetical protein